MKAGQITKTNKIQSFLTVAFVVLVLFFVLLQFLYIAGVLLGTFGGALLGIVTIIRELSLFESFIASAGFALFLLSIGTTMLVRNQAIKSIAFNIGFAFLALCIFETYLYWKQKNDSFAIALSEVKVTIPTTFWSTDKHLGIVPAPQTSSHVTSSYKDELLYDVTYTIDEHSHRISPPYIGGKDGKSLLFLGCSVTFGYGLEDDEAFPYKAGKKLDGRYKIYNFSFGGYGTHHVLSQIDHGFVEDIVKITPAYAIYTAIPDHLRRIVGDTPWGAQDPQYVMENGEVIYKGLFNENSSVIDGIARKIKSSQTVNTLFGKLIEQNRITLFTAMVVASQSKMKAIFPDCKFVVFFLENYQQELCDKMIESLQQAGIEVYRMSEMMPDFFEKNANYQIHFPIESHPNALANEYVAEFIVNHLISPSK